MPAIDRLTVVREHNPVTGVENYTISYPPSVPPEVFFDTVVWISMSQADEAALMQLKAARRFKYRYSITNYVELLSRLAKGRAPGWDNPFGIVRGAFRKIRRLCDGSILPSPEMDFLSRAELENYLHPDWVPNFDQTTIAVDLIANAETEGDITGRGIQTVRSTGLPRWVIDPSHYLELTQTDEASMTDLMEDLRNYVTEPLTKENVECIRPWVIKLAGFFLW